MVSNARLDLPEPESPVTTISLSRGISSETFFKLCTRAPCTAMVVRGAEGPAADALRCDREAELRAGLGLTRPSLKPEAEVVQRRALRVQPAVPNPPPT